MLYVGTSGYSYDDWVPKINFLNENTDFTFIAFNNHFKAQGAVNAKVLQQLLNISA